MKELTIEDLIELITDIAYQQATRECTGTDWFKEFLEKIEERQKH